MARASLVVVVLVLALVVPAYAKKIPDGSFEDTSSGTGWTTGIAGWSVAPSTASADQGVGLFFSVSGFSAIHGSVFAGLTNTTVGSGNSRTLTSTTFTIENKILRFHYAYITNNAPGDSTHKDPFSVTLVTTSGSPTTLASTTWTVSDVDATDLASGAVGAVPWGSATTYDTGWQQFTIDTQALKGSTATLIFQVDDSAVGGGPSGVFIDAVEQVPEPSTFALFGLGIMGLGFYGRRRFRRRK